MILELFIQYLLTLIIPELFFKREGGGGLTWGGLGEVDFAGEALQREDPLCVLLQDEDGCGLELPTRSHENSKK